MSRIRLPSPDELARKTGLSTRGAYKRLSKFRHGRISISELFEPAGTRQFIGRSSKRVDGGVTAREIMDRVPGLSLSGAERRIRDYEVGLRSLEGLFCPKGCIPPRPDGAAKWQALGNRERRENMPVLGTWEREQLEGTR